MLVSIWSRHADISVSTAGPASLLQTKRNTNVVAVEILFKVFDKILVPGSPIRTDHRQSLNNNRKMCFCIFTDKATLLDRFQDRLPLHFQLANRETAIDILDDQLQPIAFMEINIDFELHRHALLQDIFRWNRATYASGKNRHWPTSPPGIELRCYSLLFG